MTINVLGISGSLRARSFNTATLNACQELAPAGVRIESYDLRGLPFYDGDLDGDQTPEVVRDFKRRIAAADSVLIVSPEYNYSIPGVLKNALDWASRSQEGPQVFHEKPVAICGASPGMLGTARMQYHLRQVFVFLNAHVLMKPEVMIARAHEKFDQDLRLTDDGSRQVLSTFLQSFAAWTARMSRN